MLRVGMPKVFSKYLRKECGGEGEGVIEARHMWNLQIDLVMCHRILSFVGLS